MPVNSFEDYPLTWKPSKALLKFPMYISLSELLEQDILSGRLPPLSLIHISEPTRPY